MSDTITLEVAARDTLGKAVKRLRKDGVTPAVIHDHGKDSIHIQADSQAITKVFHQAGRHHPVELKLDGKKYTALIRAVSLDPRYNNVTHVVFNAVSANQTVDAEIPVVARYAEGNDATPAERAGFIVLTQLETVAVKALAKDLPDQLFYDAEKLVEVGDQITVADLDIPEKVTVETDETQTLATVFEPSALAAANDDAGGDAQADDASSVDSDNESGAEEGTQAAEIRPGGKEQKEDASQAKNPDKS